MVFGLAFLGYSYPILSSSFLQVDQARWVLDVSSTVTADMSVLKDVCFFLLQPLGDPTQGLGLYVTTGGDSGWSYRGYVSNTSPSQTMPTAWPEITSGAQQQQQQQYQIGISLEPLAELSAKEGLVHAEKAEFAKRVAFDLIRFLGSFNIPPQYLPMNIVDRWYQKFIDKFRKDPDFLTRRAQME